MSTLRAKESKESNEPPIVAGRVPPHDLDAEAAVLSASMLSAAAFAEASDVLDEDHFYSDANKLIWRAMAALQLANAAIDVVAVANWLRGHELIRSVTTQYLAQIIDATPSVHNVRAHADMVFRKAHRRRVIATCQRIAAEGYGDVGDGDIHGASAHEQWLSRAEGDLLAVTRRPAKRELAPLDDAVRRECATLTDPPEVDRDCVPTGFRCVDSRMGGFYRGELVIIAGRPGAGKSALATRIATMVAERGDAVDLFSPEMPRLQVAQRTISQLTLINLMQIRERGRQRPFTSFQRDKLFEAADHFRSLPIAVDDTPGISVLEIASKVRRAAARHAAMGIPYGLVVVDYLQRCSWPFVKGITRDREVGLMAATLKNLAVELDVPVVLLSQLNRGIESRNDKVPQLSDLRESGNLEQEADQVVFVYRESYYDVKASPFVGDLIWAKNRMGGIGKVPVGWLPWCTRFCELSYRDEVANDPEYRCEVERIENRANADK